MASGEEKQPSHEDRSFGGYAPPGPQPFVGSSAVVANVDGDADDGLEVDRHAAFGDGAEFPLARGVHGLGIELFVDPVNELFAAHC